MQQIYAVSPKELSEIGQRGGAKLSTASVEMLQKALLELAENLANHTAEFPDETTLNVTTLALVENTLDNIDSDQIEEFPAPTDSTN